MAAASRRFSSWMAACARAARALVSSIASLLVVTAAVPGPGNEVAAVVRPLEKTSVVTTPAVSPLMVTLRVAAALVAL